MNYDKWHHTVLMKKNWPNITTNLLFIVTFLNQQSKNQEWVNVLLCCSGGQAHQHEVDTAAAVRDDWVLELELSTKALRSFTVPAEGPYVQRWLWEGKRSPEKTLRRSEKVGGGPRRSENPREGPEKARKGPRRPEKAPRRLKKNQEGPYWGPSPLLRALWNSRRFVNSSTVCGQLCAL